VIGDQRRAALSTFDLVARFFYTRMITGVPVTFLRIRAWGEKLSLAAAPGAIYGSDAG